MFVIYTKPDFVGFPVKLEPFEKFLFEVSTTQSSMRYKRMFKMYFWIWRNNLKCQNKKPVNVKCPRVTTISNKMWK